CGVMQFPAGFNSGYLPATGCSFTSLPSRSVVLGSSLHQDLFYLRRKSFSSSSDGDTFEAVVPFMGESISDGTLATFLK
ncbi:hypothetical protein M569_04380, partial [Genlisea aurea]